MEVFKNMWIVFFALYLKVSQYTQLIFIVLKLTQVLHWSWWWVFSPALGAVALQLLELAVLVFARGVAEAHTLLYNRYKQRRGLSTEDKDGI